MEKADTSITLIDAKRRLRTPFRAVSERTRNVVRCVHLPRFRMFGGATLIVSAFVWSSLALLSEALGKQVPADTTAKPPAISFEKDILPILQTTCFKCHSGPSPQGGLDVQTRAGLLKGGSKGPAIVVGSAEKSPLYQRVRKGEMPLGRSQLSGPEVDQIRQWIDQGAPALEAGSLAPTPPGSNPADRAHWAFQPPKRPAVPKVKSASTVRTPIDAFVLSELEKKGLSFSPRADRVTLLRRAYFDLIGLPPTPQEADQFLADKSAKAFEKVINELLASPHYGERWGRHWLDAAGYADSEGVLAEDLIRTNAWRYRDYVIRAFNSDKPYNRFLLEQIAGDEMVDYRHVEQFTPQVVECLEATGFLRTPVDATRPDFEPVLFEEYQWRTLFNTQQMLGSSLLGLTLQCARCHDHKYEPISQKDYYHLEALFAGALRPNGPVLPFSERQVLLASPAELKAVREINAQVDTAEKAIADKQKLILTEYRAKHPKGEKATEDELREMFPECAAKLDELSRAREVEQSNHVAVPAIRAFYDLDANPPPTHILKRGDYHNAGEEVQPGVPQVLDDPEHTFRVPPPPAGAYTTGRRLAFARWLTRPDHPLTARVMVNRIWAYHFGMGIVPIVDNFGRSGPRPSNQALLDWLATEFVRQDWSIKKLQRLIMTSTVYRQASGVCPEGMAFDPENKLLWRMNPRRLEAEIVRDTVLAAAGTLDPTMYGPPVLTETKSTGEVVPLGEKDSGRRSIYLLVRRSRPQSVLNVLDAPIMEINCTRRTTSTTASQALAFMNGEFISAQAEHFAQHVLKEAPLADLSKPADPKSVTYAFRIALARQPTSKELRRMLTFVQEQADRYNGENSQVIALKTYTDLCQALLSTNEFIYVD